MIAELGLAALWLAAALAALAQAVPDAGPLVARLTAALDAYDLAAIQKLLAEQQPAAANSEPTP